MESRMTNASRNIAYGVINRIINILFPFLSRTVIIYILGIEYVGLNSLFSSILGMLSLAELGIGSALVYGMYEPIAMGDIESIGKYLAFYKKCYKVIGFVILCVGLAILPFLRYFINGNPPDEINVYVLFLLYLFNTVISYLLFAYRQSLFIAYQRNDIVIKISSICTILTNIIQIVLLLLLKNYYIYVVVIPLMTFFNNVFIFILSKKKFPNIYECGKLEVCKLERIKQNVVGLFFQKIGSIVLTSVDSIVISAFLGLTVLGKYNNYYYIILALLQFFNLIQASVIPSIGNSLIVETKEKNYKDFCIFHFIYNWLNIWCTTCFFCLIQPFIRLWLGEENQLSFSVCVLFAIYIFIFRVNDISRIYKEAAGMWYQLHFIPLLASALNLVLNIILIQMIDIKGVILSTVFAHLFLYIPCDSYVIFKFYFGSIKMLRKYWGSMIRYTLNAIIICGFTFCFSNFVQVDSLLIEFLVKFFVCMVIPNLLMIVLNYKTREFDAFCIYIKKFKGRLRRYRRM